MTEPAALSLEHIAKRFGRVEALVDASLAVRAGAVHALLGENGAGKTTLMRVAFGLVHPDAGTVRVCGEAVTFPTPAAALARGIGMVHQHFTFVPAMTVAENVALAGGGWRGAPRVRAIAEETGLALDPNARAGELPVGAQQRLEIVKALARGARILILDEPTAVLAPAEVAALAAVLRRFAAAGGAVVVITHKLREALAFADDVTVLRRGRTVLTGAAAGVGEEALARAMLGGVAGVAGAAGAAIAAPTGRAPSAPREVVIEARGVAVADARGVPRVRGASFDVRGGEIVGVAGVEGAGQHQLLLALAGRLAPSEGTLRLPARVGFIPADRQRDALVLDFALYENVALRDAGRARGRMPWPSIVSRTAEFLERFDVRAPGPRSVARALSGGNQQKLVLARELDGAPEALVAENPTRGLDIAATAAVHQRLVAARDAGVAVVVYSSDLDEVLSLADRVLAMFAGVVREVPVDRAAVGQAMLGVS